MIEPKWDFWSIVTAIVARIIFAIHMILSVWRVVVYYDKNVYWVLLIGLLLLICESIYTIAVRKAEDYKWISPCIAIYLLSIIPCIWLLEFYVYDFRMSIKSDFDLGQRILVDVTEQTVVNLDGLNYTLFSGATLPVESAPWLWINGIQQFFLFALIVARWILPKNEISRHEVSLLLLCYIGMAADIIELFETFRAELIRYNLIIIIIILVFWTVSLTQFAIILTSEKPKEIKGGFGHTDFEEPGEDEEPSKFGPFSHPEALGIMMMLLVQDIPFFFLRVVLINKYQVRSFMTFFFVVKNLLVTGIMLFRLFDIIVKSGKKKQYEDDDDDEYQ